ncbi:hypothetical protein CC80DRAFT_500204 [Byssothecium circinans]|uniref:Mid2 domain-containing protein n=1 Tax=Byssothecium circinans TaxID=147558 RepID=A0A6A5UG03_9PLEO|nr:hypothetical protein CC80DRAFT_500204 [Byssothecium circinans]
MPITSKGKGDVPDLEQAFTAGDVLPIAWNAGWSRGQGADKQPNSVDLWVTQYVGDGYKKKLKSNISLNEMGTYNWTIDVPNPQIDTTAQYVLRFVDHTDKDVFPTTSPMLPSVGFILHPAAKVVTSSATPSASTTFVTPSSSTSSTPSSASSSAKAKSSKVAPIIGGVLGGLTGLALILVGALIILKMLKKKKEGQKYAGELEGLHTLDAKGSNVVYRHELHNEPPELYTPGGYHHVTELDSTAMTAPPAGSNAEQRV